MAIGDGGIDASIPLQSRMAPGIDLAKSEMNAYTLADASDKFQQRQTQNTDDQIVKEYLQSGGDLATSAGFDKAAQSLKGSLSPKTYEMLIGAGQETKMNEAKMAAALAQKTDAELTSFSAQNNMIVDGLSNVMANYDKTKSVDQFNKDRDTLIQSLGQEKGSDGKPLLNPQLLAQHQNTTPEQARNELARSQHAQSLLKTQADIRKANSEAFAAEAHGSLYTAQAKNFGEGGGKPGSTKTAFVDGVPYHYNAAGRVVKEDADGNWSAPLQPGEIPKQVQDAIQGIKPPAAQRKPTPFSQSQIVSMQRAGEDLGEVKKLLFKHDASGKMLLDKKGAPQFNEGMPLAINVPVTGFMPFDKNAEEAYSRLSSALALRSQLEYGMRGAGNATSQEEMKKRYWIGHVSDPASALDKVTRLEKAFSLAKQYASGDESVLAEFKKQDPSLAGVASGEKKQEDATAPEAGGRVTLGSKSELVEAFKSKKIKVGDHFIGPDGQEHVLTKEPQ